MPEPPLMRTKDAEAALDGLILFLGYAVFAALGAALAYVAGWLNDMSPTNMQVMASLGATVGAGLMHRRLWR